MGVRDWFKRKDTSRVRYKRLSSADKDEVRAMYEDGMQPSEIAADLELNPHTVKNVIHRDGASNKEDRELKNSPMYPIIQLADNKTLIANKKLEALQTERIMLEYKRDIEELKNDIADLTELPEGAEGSDDIWPGIAQSALNVAEEYMAGQNLEKAATATPPLPTPNPAQTTLRPPPSESCDVIISVLKPAIREAVASGTIARKQFTKQVAKFVSDSELIDTVWLRLGGAE